MTEHVNHSANDSANDPVFIAEQEHLSKTYQTLVSMQKSIVARMEKTAATAENYKRTMADEATSNFASEGEAQETYTNTQI